MIRVNIILRLNIISFWRTLIGQTWSRKTKFYHLGNKDLQSDLFTILINFFKLSSAFHIIITFYNHNTKFQIFYINKRLATL